MNLRDAILRVRTLATPRRAERELRDELAFHIERETQKQIAEGLSPTDARARALARFGSVPLAADQCRDARRTGFVDDLARDIRYALRTFRRAPLAALTIVATVALGLGLIAVVFAIYNTLFLRADAVKNPGELFAVERMADPSSPRAGASLAFTRAEYEALRRETSVFADAFATVRFGVPTRIEGRRVTSALVTGNFFQVLGAQAALGRSLTTRDDERFAAQSVIVLSHMGWNKLLQGDPNAIGRRLLVNGLPYEIVGIMPEGFRGLGIGPPDFWAPLALAGQLRNGYPGGEDEIAIDVVGRLKPGISPDAATAGLTAWASGRTDLKALPTRRPVYVRLMPRQGTVSADVRGQLMIFSPIFFAFGLILMIGCANVANLLLARGVSRQREIGIRLSLGASRRRVVRQMLTESLLLALAAAACGLAVSRLFVAGALYTATNMVPSELWQADITRWAPTIDWRVVVFMVTGAAVSTVFFGLAPALQATRLELVRTMRGELTKDTRPGRARRALISVQVGASTLLLICAAIFLRGVFAATTVDPGVRTNDTVMVAIPNEPRRAALLQAISAHPSVAIVASSSPQTPVVAETLASAESTAEGPAAMSSRFAVDYMAVSPEYFDVLGIDVVSGRGFTQAERTEDAGVVIVSETIARRLWPNRDAVGRPVRLHARESALPGVLSPPSRTLTVVGVVRDVGGGLRMPDMFRFRGVYVPTRPERSGTSLMLRVRGDPEQTRQALLEQLTRVDPGLGAIVTMRSLAAIQMYVLRIAFLVTLVLGGLALVLTLSGLFSVLSYVVEQQAKDLGIRVALGATRRNIVEAVLSQGLRPVGIGLVAGGGLAAAVAIVLMNAFGAAEIGSVVHVHDPVAYAASVLVILTSCALASLVPALRAARIDPLATLRQD